MGRRGTGGSAKGVAFALVLAASALSHGAFADATPAEIAAARQLFKEGKDLETSGAWGDALAKFKTVGQVKMTPQVRFHLGLCEENLGKLVSAINDFELAADEAKKPDANAPEVLENAPVHAEALRKRVPKIRFAVKGKLSTSKLMLDGEPVAAALVGTAIPADPGAHKVDLESASGKRLFHRDLTLRERATEEVAVEVSEEDADEPDTTDDDATPPVKPDKPKEVTTGSRAPAIVAGVVGALSLVGAGVFYGLEQGTISDLESGCPSHKNCSPTLQSEFNSGHTDGTVSAVMLGVGIAGLATAGVLWFALAPQTKPAPAQGSQGGHALLESVSVAPTPFGAVVRGAF